MMRRMAWAWVASEGTVRRKNGYLLLLSREAEVLR